MNKKLEAKLKELPREPGVYFHKSQNGEIIYVGKAAVLKNRVKQYFQKSRPFDPKTEALVAEITDTDWITVETELDALFLESEMIKRYKPRYNILLRDDKSQIYIRIPMKETYPSVTYTRGPLDDGAQYFGPYYNGWAIKKAMKYLRKVFPYSTHEVLPKRVCLQYHLGLCPGVEEAKISEKEYKDCLRKLMLYLKGGKKQVIAEIEKEMKAFAKSSRFELAAERRNQLNDLRALQRQIIFSDKEFMDLSKDQALSGLQRLLTLSDIPKRIEGYDISHMQGTNNVASMVVATNGLADKAQYRKFKMRIPGNNDFAHMNETMLRRFSGRHTDWPKPSLILIDGGKGQLSAALDALDELGVSIPVVGLAKREEEIVVHKSRSHVVVDTDAIKAWAKEKNPFDEPTVQADPGRGLESKYVSLRVREDQQPGITGDSEDFLVVRLPKNNHIVKLLQRIRDESHRFAVSYHTHLKRTGQVKSILDDIPGVGPATRKKLLKAFGSVAGIKEAQTSEVAQHTGLIKAKTIKAYLDN
ncbi:MAG: excinuclease ABC subunit UvrC [Candidatus Saccharimonadales bacterium]